ncbi:DNA methyltransferase [Mycobacterium phage LittleLaf]|uniref:DNA methyltransferase n=2 Tax=Marvinvirus marvin TaxID=1982092 RepID=G1BNA0_9CAUD|nr:DNA methyltransferase [Mycobacterium phage Marvin]AEJ95314.1 DNA methyltransferase [Mycobacterium phage Marvin]AYB69838.1 DNA methyltransferase [Mycobacterium phage LittleLaf]URP22525.1 DNA methyltransferase [Mycobacterium phage Huphlepuff]WAA20137.1 DNA methyltransferase [Mycobacterium phage Clarkson]
MAKGLLLDIFCGAGGATKGYQDAGFKVVGVDNRPQPHYVGDDFVQDDALDFLARNAWKFDAIHASPPCQRYSKMTRCQPGLAEKYPDYVPKLRAWLDFYGKPYVIENVPEAPLPSPVILCGSMFGYELYRHRAFQTNFRVKPPMHPFHHKSAVHPDDWKPGLVMSVVGNCAPIEHARKIMGISWMNRDELSEAIPPYYTAYIGDFLRRRLDRLARL